MSRTAPRPRRLVAGLLVVALTAVGCSYTSRDALPTAAASMQSSTLYAADGTAIRTFHAEENRQDVSLEQIPLQMRDAVIAIEDERFYRHHGVDVRAVMRAARANADSSGDVAQGGSTITQQYVKQVLLADTSKTASRKLREAALAVQLERHYSKDRILELYLNAVYFGNGAYGVEAAAQQYFRKDVGQLDLAEEALLAGLIQRPTANDPYDNPKAALARRNVVLDKMASNHFAAKAEVAAAKKRALRLGDPTIPSEQRYPAAYFAQAVQNFILHSKLFGATAQQRRDLLFGGGLRIQTTVDLKAQAAAEAAANAILPDGSKDPDVALVSMDPSTGAIKAMVGGRDFFGAGKAAKVNLAMRGRQTGSSFKPFVLAAALQQGLSPAKSYNAPACVDIPHADAGHDWHVCNAADGESFGPTNLVEATVHSINTYYAQLVMDVGPKAAVDEAKALGVQTLPLQDNAAAVLGTNDVTPVDMADAYSTFANQGERVAPFLVSRITRADGTVLYAHQQSEKRVLPTDIANTVTAILQGVIQRGTGTAANIGRPAAGKTGTTDKEGDAWFVGYTPQLTTAVWVGFHAGELSMQPPRTPITVFGGTYPARIWQRYMSTALADQPVQQFTAPPASAFLPSPGDTVAGDQGPTEQELYDQIQQYYQDNGISPNDIINGGTDGGGSDGSSTDDLSNRGTDDSPRSTTTTEGQAHIARVPDVTGQDAGPATAQLRAAGFKVSRHASGGAYTRGTVVTQSPPGGSLATIGSTVSIGVVGG